MIIQLLPVSVVNNLGPLLCTLAVPTVQAGESHPGLGLFQKRTDAGFISNQQRVPWVIVTPAPVSRTSNAVIRGTCESQAGAGIHIPDSIPQRCD